MSRCSQGILLFHPQPLFPFHKITVNIKRSYKIQTARSSTQGVLLFFFLKVGCGEGRVWWCSDWFRLGFFLDGKGGWDGIPDFTIFLTWFYFFASMENTDGIWNIINHNTNQYPMNPPHVLNHKASSHPIFQLHCTLFYACRTNSEYTEGFPLSGYHHHMATSTKQWYQYDTSIH